MAHKEIQLSGKYDVLGLASQSVATTTKTGSFWSLGEAKGGLFVIVVGAWTAAVTLSVLQSNGVTTKAVAGKSTALASGDANSVVLLEVEASELDVANGYSKVALKAVAAGAGAILGAALVRQTVRHESGYIV